MVTAVESTEFKRDPTQILARVRAGERFVITEAGHAVAKLEPANPTPERRASMSEIDRTNMEETIRAFRDIRSRTVPTTPGEIREMINEGRR